MYPYHTHGTFPRYDYFDFYDFDIDDEDIEKIVLSTIDADPYIVSRDKKSIRVEVENGVVTLSGTVEKRVSKWSAFSDAFWNAGVVDVKNNITVSDKRRKSQTKIASVS